MKKLLLFAILLCVNSLSMGALTYDAANYIDNITFAGGGDTDFDPIYLNMDEVETAIEAFGLEGGVNLVIPTTGYIEMTEISAPSNPAANTLRLYTKDSTGTTVLAYRDSAGSETELTSGTGDNTLDNAYDQGGAGAGRTIDADSGAVAITVSDTDNNVGLIVTQNDTTSDPTAVQIVSAADAANAISRRWFDCRIGP
jgi:hypothetical protein